jgi:nucleoside-diphosphate-sugar epimerase
MKVFVIGGTGFLGTYLLPKLLKEKHEVTVLTRHKATTHILQAHGFQTVIGDLLQPDFFISSLTPHDVVISIAMPDIKPHKISNSEFKVLQNHTTKYFSTSIAVAESFNCPLVLTLGTSFRTRPGQVADENWPIERFGMTRVGELVDPLIALVERQGSPQLIQLLPGEIYGPGGLFKNLMYEWMKKGKYRVIGSGDNHIPRVHVEDCAEAYIQVLKKMPVGEKFIIADDGPCTVRDFADYMAALMNVPRPKSLPGFIAKMAIGKLLYETVTMNCVVSNSKAKQQLDWTLRYPSFREGLPATIDEIENERQE